MRGLDGEGLPKEALGYYLHLAQYMLPPKNKMAIVFFFSFIQKSPHYVDIMLGSDWFTHHVTIDTAVKASVYTHVVNTTLWRRRWRLQTLDFVFRNYL